MLDRGRATELAHYVQGPDEPIMAPLPISCNFKLGNTEPNLSKFLTIIRSLAVGATTKPVATFKAWQTTKGTSQVQDANPEGTALVTTPGFADPVKWCTNWELLWSDPDGTADKGFQWKEVYIPPDRALTEGETDVMVDLSGEVYGAINPITAFTAGTES